MASDSTPQVLPTPAGASRPWPFRRRRPSTRRRIPFYEQHNIVDCGPACLRMVLEYFGRAVGPQELRAACMIGRDGASAKTLLDVARQYGLQCTFAKKLDPAALADMPRPAILHWGFSHFVVLERYSRNGSAVILDPGSGRRRVGPAELGREFTGVALFFDADRPLTSVERRPSLLAPYLDLLRSQGGLLAGLAVISIVLQVLGTFGAKATQIAVDEIVPLRDGRLAGFVLGAMAMAAALQGAYVYGRSRLLISLRARFDLEMGLRFLRHVLALPLSFLEQRTSGDLILRLTSNMALRELLSTRALATVLDSAMLLIVVVWLSLVSPRLTVVVVGLGTLRLIVALAFRARWQDAIGESTLAASRSQGCALEILQGVLPLKAAGREAAAVERWRRLLLRSVASTSRLAEL